MIIKIHFPKDKSITLYGANVLQNDKIYGLVDIIGDQYVAKTKRASEFKKVVREEGLGTFNPLRILGIKTKKVLVPYIEDGWIYDGFELNSSERVESVYLRYELTKRKYIVPYSWIEILND